MCASMEDEGLKECEGIISCLSSKWQYVELGKGIKEGIASFALSIFHLEQRKLTFITLGFNHNYFCSYMESMVLHFQFIWIN
jgi:hypothetical protein